MNVQKDDRILPVLRMISILIATILHWSRFEICPLPFQARLTCTLVIPPGFIMQNKLGKSTYAP
jgi:hypothetical protein